jgi:hypothetical protein
MLNRYLQTAFLSAGLLLQAFVPNGAAAKTTHQTPVVNL